MSTGTQTAQEPPAPPPTKKPTASENMACIRKMGSRKFLPLPDGNHKYLQFKQWPLVVRLWSWMVEHTVEWPILNPYAVMIETWDADTGRPIYAELHIEHAAEALGIDEANARKAWRIGCRMGLWGNRPHKANEGDKYQGRRRMYFYGAVELELAEREAGKPELEEAAPVNYEEVCTNLFGSFIWKQIKNRPENEVQAWIEEEQKERELETAMHADLVAAYRLFIAQREDSRWSTRGVKVNRQEHHFKNGHAAAHNERQAAVQEIYAPVLLPLLAEAATKRFVQTSSESVQSQEHTQCKQGPEVSTRAVSLLPQTEQDKTQILVPTSSLKRAGGSVKAPPVERKSERNLQPAVEEPTQLNPEEKAAIDLLFLKMREYQNAFPHTQFGYPLVDPENKADMTWARNVLSHVGAADMDGFVYDVGERLGARDRNSLGKLPGTPAGSPQKRYIGLILEWAKDWKRGAAERERRLQEHREAKARREELIRDANARAKTQQEQAAKWNQAWEALPDDRKDIFRVQAGINLKADPQFTRSYKGMSPAQRESVIEVKAKQLFRDAEGVGGVS